MKLRRPWLERPNRHPVENWSLSNHPPRALLARMEQFYLTLMAAALALLIVAAVLAVVYKM